jgi:hypothetical protein
LGGTQGLKRTSREKLIRVPYNQRVEEICMRTRIALTGRIDSNRSVGVQNYKASITAANRERLLPIDLEIGGEIFRVLDKSLLDRRSSGAYTRPVAGCYK